MADLGVQLEGTLVLCNSIATMFRRTKTETAQPIWQEVSTRIAKPLHPPYGKILVENGSVKSWIFPIKKTQTF